MALNYVTITGTFDDGTGTALTGTVTFTPSQTVYSSGVPLVSTAAPIVAQVIAGALKSPSGGTLQLLATDNAGLTLEGLTGFWFWTASVNVGGAQSFSFFLNHTPTTQDLYSLAGVAGSGGFANPMTTLGDIIYENATPAAARLPGDTSNIRKFLRELSAAGVAQAPAWDTLQVGDLPLQPWQFTPEAQGAKRNGKVITDATIAGGALSTLTSASAAFTSADTGKSIVISQAGGAATTPLATTITFVNSTTVTLANAASGAVTNVGAIYGTDDTAAIQAAISAAVTYAQGAGNAQYAEVIFTPGYYCVAGAAVKGGSTLGNSQITLPVIAASSGVKVNLALLGLGKVTAPPEHWLNPNLNTPNATLVCMRTDGTYDATFGPAAMIGGPVSGYGGGGGTFSNMNLIVDGLTCLLPYFASYGGLMLYGVAQKQIRSFSHMPMAVVPSGAAWPQLLSGGPTSLQFPSGLIMGAVGDNAVDDIGEYTCYGAYIALAGSDHLNWKAIRTLYCGNGLVPLGVPGATGKFAHAISGLMWCCEATQFPLQAIESATTWPAYQIQAAVGIMVQALSLETYTKIVQGDTSSFLQGVIWFEDLSQSSGLPFQWASQQNSSSNLKLMAINQTRGALAAGTPAVPSSGTAFTNLFYLDAAVTVTGGTVTAVSIDGVAQGYAATGFTVTVPSGHTITLTYSAAPTWRWVLM